MSRVPPQYSTLPPKAPEVHEYYTPPPPRPGAPYPVGSRLELVKAETAILDPEIVDSTHPQAAYLHRDDFALIKRYAERKIVVIDEVVTRKYKARSPPLHADHSLYVAFVEEINQPCHVPVGESFEIKHKEVMAGSSDDSPLTEGQFLGLHDRAYVFVDIKNGPPRGTPIVICRIDQSRILAEKIKYFAQRLQEGTGNVKYFIERRLVHEELQPVLPPQPSSTSRVNVGSRHGHRI